MTEHDTMTIDASPTKDFFISMLTKDIDLIHAILDLVDNCLDGARRTGPVDSMSAFQVRIEVDKEHFTIKDNCGGIPFELARDYAFRFGRDEHMPSIPHSIGEFGIGMKRALFKLGKRFRIQSTAADSRFEVAVDVEEWKRTPEWKFRFTRATSSSANEEFPQDDRGTIVEVTFLYEAVADEFRLENFQTRLRTALEAVHQDAMNKGLAVTINAIPLKPQALELLCSERLLPAREVFSINGHDPGVHVELYAGILHSDSPGAAGWYVFCNGRTILTADQSLTTGWGEGRGRMIPTMHPQFALFRGYALFDSDDGSLLPWNTTKTGMDESSPTYRSVRQRMIVLMRPVIDFLNALDREINQEEQPLAAAVQECRQVQLGHPDLRTAARFTYPTAPSQRPSLSRVSYSKPADQVKRAKEVLGVGTNKEVGEKTFDYYFELECQG